MLVTVPGVPSLAYVEAGPLTTMFIKVALGSALTAGSASAFAIGSGTVPQVEPSTAVPALPPVPALPSVPALPPVPLPPVPAFMVNAPATPMTPPNPPAVLAAPTPPAPAALVHSPTPAIPAPPAPALAAASWLLAALPPQAVVPIARSGTERTKSWRKEGCMLWKQSKAKCVPDSNDTGWHSLLLPCSPEIAVFERNDASAAHPKQARTVAARHDSHRPYVNG